MLVSRLRSLLTNGFENRRVLPADDCAVARVQLVDFGVVQWVKVIRELVSQFTLDDRFNEWAVV